MYNPRKINLYLKNELPLILTQKGGKLNEHLINNNRNKYLKADKTVETFINGASQIINDVELWFEFKDDNLIQDSENDNLHYIEKTQKILSFSIKQLVSHSNVVVKGMSSENLVLKLVDLSYKKMDKFIEDWKEHKKILEESIPNIYMYGELYTEDNVFICNYYITDTYKNHNSILKLDYIYTIKYIIKMLLFIQKCIEKNIIIRNLKFSSIGYTYKDSEIIFLLANYEDTILLNKNDDFFKINLDSCDSICAGTLVPYFIIIDYFNMNPEWIEKLDKLYVIGLAEILIFLLYSQNEIMEEFFNMLYSPSQLKPCLHYYHYKNIFDNSTKKKKFTQLFNLLQPKFIESNSKIINNTFKQIIINCFDTNYNAIKSTSTYLNHINTTLNQIKELKDNIKIYIKPIDTPDVFIKNKVQVEQKLLDKDELLQDSETDDLKSKLHIGGENNQNNQNNENDVESIDLEKLVQSDDFANDDIIYKIPNNKQPLKPILKNGDSGINTYKKVGFADINSE